LPPKQKARWAIRASGVFKLFSWESARQASMGAAAGRDGDGVDASGETLGLQNTRQEWGAANRNFAAPPLEI
jgi:hypothetical protein